jgi:hypothetical protein
MRYRLLMSTAIHILKFLISAALGYGSIFLIVAGALQLGIIDSLPADEHLNNFRLAYMGGGLFVSIAGTLLGVSSFFMKGRSSTLFLLMPLLAPALYSIVVLTYFSTLPH